ncbi:MAG: sodium/solute symporter [Verrucomicrobia bacterium]|nr:sodium/solute symporter [Verrucomicrobiota bacterium]
MLGGFDWAVIVLYFVIIAAIGVWATRNNKTTEDYFLGGRRMPWTTAMLSLLATEASAVTFIGAPGDSYGGNMTYLQMAIGSLAARIIVAAVFLTAFYKFRVTTVYEFLKHRFGEATRGTGSAFFIVTRLLASGVRLCVMAKVLDVVVPQIQFPVCLALVAGIAMAYTFFGGIRAVMWTDVLQFGIFMGGAWLAFGLLLSHIDGGWSSMMEVARAEGKDRMFDFSFSFMNKDIFWAAVAYGLFTSLAAFGTDQDMTQRMLTCRKPSLAKRGLILTGIIDFPIVLTFLLIGLALYALNAQNGFASGIEGDEVFPTFIVKFLPVGIKGLLLACVFAAAMSSLDSALSALSSSAVVDLYRAYIKKDAPDKHYLLVSRLFVVVFALCLVLVAWLCRDEKNVLWLAFRMVSYTYGGLLGVFLLGLLTNRGRSIPNVIAMITSVGVAVLYGYGFDTAPHLMIMTGTAWAFLFGALFSKKREVYERVAL